MYPNKTVDVTMSVKQQLLRNSANFWQLIHIIDEKQLLPRLTIVVHMMLFVQICCTLIQATLSFVLSQSLITTAKRWMNTFHNCTVTE